MALFGDFKEGYTRTGDNFFSRASNYLSYVPGLNRIPVLGGGLVAVTGMLGAGIESIGWLLRGKVGSAATVLATGAVGSAVNAADGLTWGALNIGSTLTTGRSISVHARKLTEEAIGGATGFLGMKPQVLASYTAGMGSVGAASTPSGPGKFPSQVADERGVDRNELYKNYMSGEGGAHVNELGSAYRSM